MTADSPLPYRCSWCHPTDAEATGLCAVHAWAMLVDYKRRRDTLQVELLEAEYREVGRNWDTSSAVAE